MFVSHRHNLVHGGDQYHSSWTRALFVQFRQDYDVRQKPMTSMAHEASQAQKREFSECRAMDAGQVLKLLKHSQSLAYVGDSDTLKRLAISGGHGGVNAVLSPFIPF